MLNPALLVSLQTLLKKTTTDDELIDALRKVSSTLSLLLLCAVVNTPREAPHQWWQLQEVHENRRKVSTLTQDLDSTRSDLMRTTSVAGAKVLNEDEYSRLTRQNTERKRQVIPCCVSTGNWGGHGVH